MSQSFAKHGCSKTEECAQGSAHGETRHDKNTTINEKHTKLRKNETKTTKPKKNLQAEIRYTAVDAVAVVQIVK